MSIGNRLRETSLAWHHLLLPKARPGILGTTTQNSVLQGSLRCLLPRSLTVPPAALQGLVRPIPG
jgi:hypothetical protein